MKKLTLILTAIFFAFLLISCNQNTSDEVPNENMGSGQKVVVAEVIQGTKYTYAKVKSQSASYWVACAKTEVAVGDEVYHDAGLEMRDFRSKELDRTFDTIYFVPTLSGQMSTGGQGMAMKMPMKSPHQNGGMMMQQPTTAEAVAGKLTLAELINNRTAYADKQVTVSGKVTKFLTGIMNKNFLHLQPESQDGQKLDLAVTTNEMMQVGDVVTLTGKIAVNKDFGAGYYYEVIMEDAHRQTNN
ncbi:MAG: DNA-binding protein [Deferribacteres bacterium]|nr:DNA-binding protein [candidate division KSB1 bacterium]MCB9504305.1 DNA-binding protein [Deferribacteres bacterium]